MAVLLSQCPLCSIFCCRFDVFLLFTPLLILGAPEKGPVSMYIHEIPTWRKWISGPIITTGLDERASSHLGIRRLENCPDGVWELHISGVETYPKMQDAKSISNLRKEIKLAD